VTVAATVFLLNMTTKIGLEAICEELAGDKK
jgi:hypothetical protein